MNKTIIVVDSNGDEHAYTDDEEGQYNFFTPERPALSSVYISVDNIVVAQFFNPRYIKIFRE